MTKKRKKKIYAKKVINRYVKELISSNNQGNSEFIPKGILKELIKNKER